MIREFNNVIEADHIFVLPTEARANLYREITTKPNIYSDEKLTMDGIDPVVIRGFVRFMKRKTRAKT